MKKSILLFLLLVYGLSYGQYVDIVEKGKTENLTPKEFMIPLKNIENYQFAFVARYKAYYPNTYIGHLFTAIAAEAKNNGANAYNIISYKEGNKEEDSELVLDTYFIEDSEIDKISQSLEKNVVYFFGEASLIKESISKFKINGEKRELKNNTFVKKILKENDKIKIVKGGITGMAILVKWRPDQFNRFYNFSGIEMNGAGFSGNGIGIGFSTGRINQIDRDLGYFLIQVLKEN